MPNKIIILRGCPAVGKGSVARELVKKLDGRVAKLTLDDFQWEMTATRKRTKKDFEISFNNYLHILEEYLKKDYSVITEDVWLRYYGYPDKSTDINKVIKIGKKYGVEINLVLLKAEWSTIKSRNSIRHRVMKEKELKDVYNKIYSKNLNGEFIIKVDGKSAIEISKEILKCP